MADKKKSTKKPDLPKSKGPRREIKEVVNPETGKTEKMIITYD